MTEAIRDELLAIRSFYDVSLEYVDPSYWGRETSHGVEEEDTETSLVVFHDDVSDPLSILGKSILRIYSTDVDRSEASDPCWVDLNITFLHGYPEELPQFLVSNSYGIPFSLQENLQTSLHAFFLERSTSLQRVTAAVHFIQTFLRKHTHQQRWKLHRSLSHAHASLQLQRALSDSDLSFSYRKNKETNAIYTPRKKLDGLLPFPDEGSTLSFTKSSRFLREYEELQLIGSGGFGAVVKVKQRFGDGIFALKCISITQKDELTSLTEEASMLAKLKHRYIVRYYDAWIEKIYIEEGALPTKPASTCSLGPPSSASSSEEERPWVYGQPRRPSFATPSGWPLDAKKQPFMPPSPRKRLFSFSERSGRFYAGKHRHPSTLSPTPPYHQFLYILMEYCPSHSLRKAIDNGVFQADRLLIWRLAKQIVDALAYMHEVGVIHRDLKPSNIFLSEDESGINVKIGDFGLTTSIRSKTSREEIFRGAATVGGKGRSGAVGTMYYMAPELEEDDASYTEKVDMFSFGIVFFEMWHPPFLTTMERSVVLHSLTKLKKFPPEFERSVDPSILQILRNLLFTSVEERFSAETLLQSTLFQTNFEAYSKKVYDVLSRHPYSNASIQLMATLFSRYESEEKPRLTFPAKEMPSPAFFRMIISVEIYRFWAQIFRRRGAVFFTLPILQPKTPLTFLSLHFPSLSALSTPSVTSSGMVSKKRGLRPTLAPLLPTSAGLLSSVSCLAGAREGRSGVLRPSVSPMPPPETERTYTSGWPSSTPWVIPTHPGASKSTVLSGTLGYLPPLGETTASTELVGKEVAFELGMNVRASQRGSGRTGTPLIALPPLEFLPLAPNTEALPSLSVAAVSTSSLGLLSPAAGPPFTGLTPSLSSFVHRPRGGPDIPGGGEVSVPPLPSTSVVSVPSVPSQREKGTVLPPSPLYLMDSSGAILSLPHCFLYGCALSAPFLHGHSIMRRWSFGSIYEEGRGEAKPALAGGMPAMEKDFPKMNAFSNLFINETLRCVFDISISLEDFFGSEELLLTDVDEIEARIPLFDAELVAVSADILTPFLPVLGKMTFKWTHVNLLPTLLEDFFMIPLGNVRELDLWIRQNASDLTKSKLSEKLHLFLPTLSTFEDMVDCLWKIVVLNRTPSENTLKEIFLLLINTLAMHIKESVSTNLPPEEEHDSRLLEGNEQSNILSSPSFRSGKSVAFPTTPFASLPPSMSLAFPITWSLPLSPPTVTMPAQGNVLGATGVSTGVSTAGSASTGARSPSLASVSLDLKEIFATFLWHLHKRDALLPLKNKRKYSRLRSALTAVASLCLLIETVEAFDKLYFDLTMEYATAMFSKGIAFYILINAAYQNQQDILCSGGRYDTLIHTLHKTRPAVGRLAGFGFEVMVETLIQKIMEYNEKSFRVMNLSSPISYGGYMGLLGQGSKPKVIISVNRMELQFYAFCFWHKLMKRGVPCERRVGDPSETQRLKWQPQMKKNLSRLLYRSDWILHIKGSITTFKLDPLKLFKCNYKITDIHFKVENIQGEEEKNFSSETDVIEFLVTRLASG